VGAVLGDALRRVAVLGGREGMPRSLGSVYGGAVTRFLGGGLRGIQRRVVGMLVKSIYSGIGVTVDGSTLLVSQSCFPDSVHKISLTDDAQRCRVIGGKGTGPLEFDLPQQVYVAPDGFVFVADYGNNRVQVLTPSLDFHACVGAGHMQHPGGVCANADVVVVSEYEAHHVAVFSRGDGAFVRRFGRFGTADGQLHHPHALCFMSGDRHIAVVEWRNSRVSVFSVEGEFIRHVGVGVLSHPMGVAASAFDELVVTDTGNDCLRVFSSAGDVVATMGAGRFNAVALHGGAVFTVEERSHTVLAFH
jgi:DNA-binding beta-propeller fold protein YncE